MSYKSDLIGRLKDHQYSAGYLSAALQDSSGAFLVALRDVAEAREGMTALAAQAKVNRENLYRMLSQSGNPRLSSLATIMATLGLRLRVEAIEEGTGEKPVAPAPQQKQTVSYIGASSIGAPVLVPGLKWLPPEWERLVKASTIGSVPTTETTEDKQPALKYFPAIASQKMSSFTDII